MYIPTYIHACIHTYMADIYMRAVTWPGQEAPKAFGCVAACNIYKKRKSHQHTYTQNYKNKNTCRHKYKSETNNAEI